MRKNCHQKHTQHGDVMLSETKTKQPAKLHHPIIKHIMHNISAMTLFFSSPPPHWKLERDASGSICFLHRQMKSLWIEEVLWKGKTSSGFMVFIFRHVFLLFLYRDHSCLFALPFFFFFILFRERLCGCAHKVAEVQRSSTANSSYQLSGFKFMKCQSLAKFHFQSIFVNDKQQRGRSPRSQSALHNASWHIPSW